MIKILVDRPFLNKYDGNHYIEGTCLSSDTKPNFVATNSLMLELDTKELYYCAKGGGQSEEVVYEGNIDVSLIQEGFGYAELSGFVDELPNKITVEFDGESYECESFVDGEATCWGAPAQGDSFDWSTYPFCITYNGGYIICTQVTSGTHSVSISSLVTTEAEWVKYGEGGGSDSGDMINVYFISPSDGPYTDFTTQMTRDSEITLPTADIYRGKWICTNGGLTQYDYGSSFTIPNEECIFTEDGGGLGYTLTAPYIQFTIEQPLG